MITMRFPNLMNRTLGECRWQHWNIEQKLIDEVRLQTLRLLNDSTALILNLDSMKQLFKPHLELARSSVRTVGKCESRMPKTSLRGFVEAKVSSILPGLTELLNRGNAEPEEEQVEEANKNKKTVFRKKSTSGVFGWKLVKSLFF